MKALIFGAGNIGRGFLGAILTESDYEITFVDVDANKVNEFNQIGSYPIYVVSEKESKEEFVENVSAIHVSESKKLQNAIVDADLILTAVGKEALVHVARTLAPALVTRLAQRPESDMHVVVVACENVNDNTTLLQKLILAEMDAKHHTKIRDWMSFPNCVVDRIVPNTAPGSVMSHPLAVTVEDYYQFAIDGTALRQEFAPVNGIQIAKNLSAVLEQKLFTLNMAHAVVAYFGFLKEYRYIHEAVADNTINKLVLGALGEVSTTLVARHNSISLEAQEQYAARILSRFRNSHLKDEIIRVAKQPMRKLSNSDRLIKPALLTWEQGIIPAYLANGISAALHYDFGEDEQARVLTNQIREHGVEYVLQNVSGVAKSNELTRLVASDFLYKEL